MAAVHPVAAVTDMGMTMLRCVGMWNHAGQERIEEEFEGGRAQGVYNQHVQAACQEKAAHVYY